jgi:hypothetical protein
VALDTRSELAYSKHRFHNTPHNSGGGAFAANPRSRGEDLDQWSTELRFTSETGGAIEWMAGMYFQNNKLDAWSDSYRANGRRALRAQRTSEESDWRSVFATVTFNFLGDKASLDLGGRYTGISKKAEGSNNHAEWFVIDRVEAGGDGSIVRIPAGFDIRGSSTRAQISRAILEQHPGIANGSIVGRSNMSTICTDLYGEQLNSGFISENSRCASAATARLTTYPGTSSMQRPSSPARSTMASPKWRGSKTRLRSVPRNMRSGRSACAVTSWMAACRPRPRCSRRT